MPHGLAERRRRYVASLEASLERVVAELSARPETHQVILFGSYAEGRRDLLTDLDLIVVMDSDLEFVERNARLRQQLVVDVDMDLLVYTPGEFERMRERPFVARALSTGKVLYARRAA